MRDKRWIVKIHISSMNKLHIEFVDRVLDLNLEARRSQALIQQLKYLKTLLLACTMKQL